MNDKAGRNQSLQGAPGYLKVSGKRELCASICESLIEILFWIFTHQRLIIADGQEHGGFAWIV